MLLNNIWRRKFSWIKYISSTFPFEIKLQVIFLEMFPFSLLQKDEIWLQMQHRNNLINRLKPKWSSKYTFYLFLLFWSESFGCQEWAHCSPLKTEGIFFLLLVGVSNKLKTLPNMSFISISFIFHLWRTTTFMHAVMVVVLHRWKMKLLYL